MDPFTADPTLPRPDMSFFRWRTPTTKKWFFTRMLPAMTSFAILVVVGLIPDKPQTVTIVHTVAMVITILWIAYAAISQEKQALKYEKEQRQKRLAARYW